MGWYGFLRCVVLGSPHLGVKVGGIVRWRCSRCGARSSEERPANWVLPDGYVRRARPMAINEDEVEVED